MRQDLDKESILRSIEGQFGYSNKNFEIKPDNLDVGVGNFAIYKETLTKPPNIYKRFCGSTKNVDNFSRNRKLVAGKDNKFVKKTSLSFLNGGFKTIGTDTPTFEFDNKVSESISANIIDIIEAVETENIHVQTEAAGRKRRLAIVEVENAATNCRVVQKRTNNNKPQLFWPIVRELQCGMKALPILASIIMVSVYILR